MVAKLIINETNPIAANITCLIDNALGILRLLDTLCCGRNDGIVIVSVIVVDTELSSQCSRMYIIRYDYTMVKVSVLL